MRNGEDPESPASVAGPSAEHKVSRPTAFSLISVLHCPQPVAIARKKKVTSNSPPRAWQATISCSWKIRYVLAQFT